MVHFEYVHYAKLFMSDVEGINMEAVSWKTQYRTTSFCNLSTCEIQIWQCGRVFEISVIQFISQLLQLDSCLTGQQGPCRKPEKNHPVGRPRYPPLSAQILENPVQRKAAPEVHTEQTNQPDSSSVSPWHTYVHQIRQRLAQ